DTSLPVITEAASNIHFDRFELPELPPPEKRQPPPEPEPPEPPPQAPEVAFQKIDRQLTPVEFEWPTFNEGIGPPIQGITTFNRPQEGDVAPISSVAPQYPMDALRNNIEGYVTLQFTITEAGTVINPRVIDAHPRRVFDQAAIRAIVRWRFKPRIVNGTAVSREATQTLEFTLEGNGT
ncbi:MAG: energy transducer TonB, partial [Pseudomonadota bacterium]